MQEPYGTFSLIGLLIRTYTNERYIDLFCYFTLAISAPDDFWLGVLFVPSLFNSQLKIYIPQVSVLRASAKVKCNPSM